MVLVDLLDRRLQLHGQAELGDQLGRLGADDVRAEISPVLASLITLTKPSVSAEATALPEAVKGNLPTL